MDELGARNESRLLDLGCGQGRLPIALAPRLPQLDYLGLDVSARCIDWCKAHVQAPSGTYRFDRLHLVNERYNPSGPPLTDRFRLPLDDSAVDIVYMWGVVTNMEPDHLPPYAAEIARVLRREGRLFLTAHVEQGVPAVSLNPDSYVPWECKGPLHVVRYDVDYFIETFEREGLTLVENRHHAVGDWQSELYFARR